MGCYSLRAGGTIAGRLPGQFENHGVEHHGCIADLGTGLAETIDIVAFGIQPDTMVTVIGVHHKNGEHEVGGNAHLPISVEKKPVLIEFANLLLAEIVS